jgi:hypothetical protein
MSVLLVEMHDAKTMDTTRLTNQLTPPGALVNEGPCPRNVNTPPMPPPSPFATAPPNVELQQPQ